MFELRPFERRNNHVAAYDPWDQMERAFFGDGSWGRGLSEFKTDIQDKGDSYLLEADLPGFKKEEIGKSTRLNSSHRLESRMPSSA